MTEEDKKYIKGKIQDIADDIAITTRVLGRCIDKEDITAVSNCEISIAIEAFGKYASRYLMFELETLLDVCVLCKNDNE